MLQYKVQRGRMVLQVSMKNPSAGGHACCRFCGNVILCELTLSSLHVDRLTGRCSHLDALVQRAFLGLWS